MKTLVKLSIILTVIVTNGVQVTAQKCQEYSKLVNIETVKPHSSKDYENWQRIDLNKFSFYAPKDLKRVEGNPRDSEFYHYKSNDYFLNIDIGFDSYAPSYEREFPSYCENFFWIDEAFASSWYFEDNSEFKYNSGVRFKFQEDRNYIITFGFFSKNQNSKEMAEKIFKSIQFKYKPKKKLIPKKIGDH